MQVLRPEKVTGHLSHSRIVEMYDTEGRGVTDKFSDKSAGDIILLNRPKWSGNQAPQPSHVDGRVSIASDNARTENR